MNEPKIPPFDPEDERPSPPPEPPVLPPDHPSTPPDDDKPIPIKDPVPDDVPRRTREAAH